MNDTIWTANDVSELLNQLRDVFYSMPGCCCGGPLHVLLDDQNLEDHFIESGRENLAAAEVDPYVRAVGTAIVDILATLSEEQRCIWAFGSREAWKYVKELEARFPLSEEAVGVIAKVLESPIVHITPALEDVKPGGDHG